MLITTTQLSQFSGNYDSELQTIYINASAGVIQAYLGFNPEEDSRWSDGEDEDEVFIGSIQFVCMEIATLMQQEEGQNIGINSKSFGESGSRTFLNVVDYTKYLHRLDAYRSGSSLTL